MMRVGGGGGGGGRGVWEEEAAEEEAAAAEAEAEEEEQEEEEEDNDKIQAAKTLAELSILPVRLSQQNSLELPDLRRTSQSVLGPGGAGKYSCNICGKQYSTSSNLARHRQTHRSPDHSKARRCNLCNKVRHSTHLTSPQHGNNDLTSRSTSLCRPSRCT